MPSDEQPTYWPFYCEENIWHLAGAALEGALVVLITNPTRSVAIWGQRAAVDLGQPVVWDYHVILLEPTGVLGHESEGERGSDAVCSGLERSGEDGWWVRDLDTVLGERVWADVYLARSFPFVGEIGEAYAPHFRVLTAAEYRAFFSSDRRHMRSADGEWIAPPPPWPAIYDSARGSTLEALLARNPSTPGEVCDVEGLMGRLAGI